MARLLRRVNALSTLHEAMRYYKHCQNDSPITQVLETMPREGHFVLWGVEGSGKTVSVLRWGLKEKRTVVYVDCKKLFLQPPCNVIMKNPGVDLYVLDHYRPIKYEVIPDDVVVLFIVNDWRHATTLMDNGVYLLGGPECCKWPRNYIAPLVVDTKKNWTLEAQEKLIDYGTRAGTPLYVKCEWDPLNLRLDFDLEAKWVLGIRGINEYLIRTHNVRGWRKKVFDCPRKYFTDIKDVGNVPNDE